LCGVVLLVWFEAVALEDADFSVYAAALNYCRSNANQLILNDDRSIFCFDGLVSANRDTSSLQALRDGGLFVVRSEGGSGIDAIKIATLLGEKRATVVIYDYCFSACAQFFFVGPVKTFVSKDSIVAWHHGWAGWPACDSIAPWRPNGAKRLTREFCHKLPEQYREVLRQYRVLAEPFFKARIIDLANFNQDTPPQSTHVAKILRSRFDRPANQPSSPSLPSPGSY